MIQIANVLLTRRCNLSCSYCAISRNYEGMPQEYPNMKHYFENEMSTEIIIDSLKRLQKHNPNIFVILYGGEPLLRSDISDIVKFCNDNNIHYTIITNNTKTVQPALFKIFHDNQLKGLTSSVDPVILIKDYHDKDRFNKSVDGLRRLEYWKKHIKDVVAEITIDNETLDYVVPLVTELTEKGISSSITFIDIAKNPYYDFSNITSKELLVEKNSKVKGILEGLTNPKYDVHMGKTLLPKIYDILSSNLDCGIEKDFHNITIDADSSVRLCIRIRGVNTPGLKLHDYIGEDGKLNNKIYENVLKDKEDYCRGCNWTCMLMSKSIENNDDVNDLIHSDRR